MTHPDKKTGEKRGQVQFLQEVGDTIMIATSTIHLIKPKHKTNKSHERRLK